tara:strand:- start:354 stop:566 length:213 start_codon:yes stop_codon:yes gene_type:complete
MKTHTTNGRLYDNADANSVGEFINKLGGYKYYNEWLRKNKTYKRTTQKIGRNELCPCNSGKKNKKCCKIF